MLSQGFADESEFQKPLQTQMPLGAAATTTTTVSGLCFGSPSPGHERTFCYCKGTSFRLRLFTVWGLR